VSVASLPGASGKNGGNSTGKTLVVVGDDQIHPGEPLAQEARLGGSIFAREGIATNRIYILLMHTGGA
jgi:hypothetical protein